ncbi:hypothetical protein CK203_103861 [Vitis vinifera]|uniref:Uncharacterized protein n=1 Tax=Vitis vinifera TaxID=29760 RepID=A0A438C7K9_VITVI|nr:hypothetical protein CK203_103861 [Vitis vinifera]
MIDELNALTINETWELVPPYPSQNVVGYKLSPRSRIDYHDTFNLVVKLTTIRAVLSIVLRHGTLVLKRLSLLCPPWNISSLMIAPFSQMQ